MAMKTYQIGQQEFKTSIEKTRAGFVIQIKINDETEDFYVDWVSYDQAEKKLRFCISNIVYQVFFKDSSGTCLSFKNNEFNIISIAASNSSEHYFSPAKVNRVEENTVKSPLAGRVTKILCSLGQRVEQGDGLVLIESMKMENEICAHRCGVIKTLFISESNLVQQNQPLVEFVEKGEKDDSAPKNINAQASV